MKKIVTQEYAVFDGKDHLDIVNNLDLSFDIIRKYHQNEDNFFIIYIVQRVKDNENVLDSTGNSIFGKKKVNNKIVAAHNFIGYIFVRGKTIEDVYESVRYPVIHLYTEYAELLGVSQTFKCGSVPFENLIYICETLNARAYMTPMKESFSEIAEITNNHKFLKQLYLSHSCHKYAYYDDYNRRLFRFVWNAEHKTNYWPWVFIDCDIPDREAVREVLAILNEEGINYEKVLTLPSHNGYHLIFDPKNIKSVDYPDGIEYNSKKLYVLRNKLNKKFRKFGVQFDEQGAIENNKITVEEVRLSTILLYSPAGDPNRNVEHPSWNVDRVFPVNCGKQSIIYIEGVYKKKPVKTKNEVAYLY